MATIHTMPDRLADLINDDIKRQKLGQQEWAVASIDLCLHLTRARIDHPDNIEFGQWCETHGFGEQVISHQTRAAAIAMGNEPEALRACLEATERRSLREIHRVEFSRFTSAGKTEKPKQSRKEASMPKTDAVREAIRPLIEAGEPINEKELCDRLGVSRATVRFAEHRELGRLEGLREITPLAAGEMKPTVQARYDAALRAAERQLREQLRTEIEAAVHRDLEPSLRRLKERETHAERIIASHKGVMSRSAYRRILACLHPDHNTFQHAAEALQIFMQLEDVLVKSEAARQDGPLLPATAAEMMARRRQHRS